MGSGCFHHFCPLHTGSFCLLTQSLFLKLPLSLRVCTQGEMFNRTVERKEGHPALSAGSGDALCLLCQCSVGCPVLAPRRAWPVHATLPHPVLWPGQACIIQGFAPSFLITAFCKRPVVFLFLNQVFFYVFSHLHPNLTSNFSLPVSDLGSSVLRSLHLPSVSHSALRIRW